MTGGEILSLALGAGLGAVFGVVGRRRGPVRGAVVFAVGLVVAAAIYPIFALVGGAPTHWTALELGGLFLYGAVAYLGRRSPLAVAAGWVAHVAWDVGLHLPEPAFVPGWYPELCVGFDLVVAVACLSLIHRAGGPNRLS